MECEFCHKPFANQYILETHQRVANYCLKIQGKMNNKFLCNKCGKSLCSKERLVNHAKKCEKRDTKESCKKKLNLSPEFLSERISRITHENLVSVDKFVEFISDIILEGSYKCTDPVKLVFSYRDMDGYRMKDPGAEKIFDTLRILHFFKACYDVIDKCNEEDDTWLNMSDNIMALTFQEGFAKELAKRLY